MSTLSQENRTVYVSPSRPGTRRGLWWIVAGVVALLAVLAVGVIALTSRGWSKSALAPESLKPVKRGPLAITVTLQGNVRNRQQQLVRSEVEQRTAITFLIEEGTRVQKDQVLVELDSSQLEDQRRSQVNAVDNADAAYRRSSETLEVTKLQTQNDVAQAALAFQLAQQDLEKFNKGEVPLDLNDAKNQITIAEEELKRSTEKLKWSEELYADKFISLTELEADRLEAKKSELQLALSKQRMGLLEYTHKRRSAELNSNVLQNENLLKKAQRKASADLIQAEADLSAKKSDLLAQQVKLERLKDQISKCTIKAPVGGLVIYATSQAGGGGGRGGPGNVEPLAVQQQVSYRQELIYIPTAASIAADVKLPESARPKVRESMSANITVRALGDKSFTGRVHKIAENIDAQSFWTNPDLKVYSTEIYVDQSADTADLRPGMGCDVQIFVETYNDALYIPLQSVTRVDGKPTVYVKSGNNLVARTIEIGLDNNEVVRVLNGLAENELVSMQPPLQPASKTETPVVPPAPSAQGAPAAPAADAAPTGRTGRRAGADQPSGSRPQLSPEERKKVEAMTPDERREYFTKLRESGGGKPPAGANEKEETGATPAPVETPKGPPS